MTRAVDVVLSSSKPLPREVGVRVREQGSGGGNFLGLVVVVVCLG